jgi:hypothetical protein
MMIELLISFFFVICLFHIAYEAVLAPSFRYYVKLRLYAVRDELRELKMAHPYRVPDDVYRELEDGINCGVALADVMSINGVRQVEHAYATDPDFKSHVLERQELLDSCSLEEVRRIRMRTNRLMGRVLLINTGGAVLYLTPVILVMFARRGWRGMRERCAKVVRMVTCLGEDRAAQLFAHSHNSALA